MVGVGRELLVRSFGNVLARIHDVMVRFFVPRQTRAFIEPEFAESTSAKQVVYRSCKFCGPTLGTLTPKCRISRFFISPLS